MKETENLSLPPFYSKEIDGDYILWFHNSNHYVQVKLPVWDAVQCISQHEKIEEAASEFSALYDLPFEESDKFISEVIQHFGWLGGGTTQQTTEVFQIPSHIKNGYFEQHQYSANNKVFAIRYYSPYFKTIIHSLFTHLETNEQATDYMNVFEDSAHIYFEVEGYKTWKWGKHENHFMRGRAYLEILRMAYAKQEKDWMTVMHAASISNGQNAVLCTADSGGGKSTFSALCRNAGLYVLADDFVPVDRLTRYVHAFPAATSVKSTAYPFLVQYFPELKNAPTINFNSKKNLRFLPPQDFEVLKDIKVPVKSLIFIKYNADVDFELEELSTLIALRSIFDQAWMPPDIDNAEAFLDWVSGVKCYTLTYSNTEKAISWVKEILNTNS